MSVVFYILAVPSISIALLGYLPTEIGRVQSNPIIPTDSATSEGDCGEEGDTGGDTRGDVDDEGEESDIDAQPEGEVSPDYRPTRIE